MIFLEWQIKFCSGEERRKNIWWIDSDDPILSVQGETNSATRISVLEVRWTLPGSRLREKLCGRTGRRFRARYYASEFEARSGASGRKTTFNRAKWKRREQFFERGNYRFVWSPRSLALQEADRDIGHIPGVRKARREPNRDLHVFSPSLSPSFLCDRLCRVRFALSA